MCTKLTSVSSRVFSARMSPNARMLTTRSSAAISVKATCTRPRVLLLECRSLSASLQGGDWRRGGCGGGGGAAHHLVGVDACERAPVDAQPAALEREGLWAGELAGDVKPRGVGICIALCQRRLYVVAGRRPRGHRAVRCAGLELHGREGLAAHCLWRLLLRVVPR